MPICVGRSKATERPVVPLREQIFVALVGLLGVAHAGVLAHGPEAAAVHGGLHAAREWIFAGIARLAFLVPFFQVRRRIELAHRDMRGGLRIRLVLRRGSGFYLFRHKSLNYSGTEEH